ncbi:hypothetical protein KUTeg_010622 [Tegillarca granosa]|uniref:Nephrin n=1 Tax=Tegillarca granosa TaxID=220873 RepID=A0ABQ9F321_TEGGR|nr:hypothetical protein KUTeg_010622 [Tegillarca granosa]
MYSPTDFSEQFTDMNQITDAAWTLTGSSEFAVTKEDFVLTCIPENNGVFIAWRRSGTTIAAIEYNNKCDIQNGSDQQYQYTCEPGPVYKLTIPANVMTNNQNNIVWRCEGVFGGVGNNAEYTLKVAAGVTLGQSTEGQSTQSDGLIVTSVSQTMTASRGVSLKTIECSAVNIQGRQPVTSQTLTLDVYYIPTIEPTLSGYTTGTVLYEGDNSLTITCQQSGGYPLSVITWSCNGQTGTSNSSRTVANPPAPPTVQTSGTSFPWVENTQGVLRCTTTPGNPSEMTYDWLQTSQVINGQTTDTYTMPTLTNFHNGLRIQCKVSNVYTVHRSQVQVSNVTILDVQYTPIITLDTTNVTVQEDPPSVTVHLQNATENDTNVVFTCNADGFPTNNTYHGWNQYIDNTLVRSYTDFTGMLSESNRKLTIPKVTFEDFGRYYCVVENGFRGRKQDVLQQGSSYFDVRAKPEPPKNLIVYETKQNSVALTWERGYDGGYHQTFVILVKVVESDSVREILVNGDAKSNNFSTKIKNLLPSTTYHIKIFAMNEYGNSSFLSLNFEKETKTGSKPGEKSEIKLRRRFSELSRKKPVPGNTNSREVGTYESLEPRDVETINTHESLQTTGRPDSGGIAMELYENTKITL